MFKLVIQDDEGKTTVVPVIRPEITIGRKEGNTIRLTERNVSRRHARILHNNGEIQIEDLGSYNGIRVNNARIAERVSLRVSDQVQIGDYKLYLKAEGVEQVDDARTMPIERVDVQNHAATEVMAAVPADGGNGTPTMPLGVPQTPPGAAAGAAPGPASGLAAAQLVGSPNRTLVAIADTDPAGRPVATAATVAALNASAGYGKLVVLSSNFAGKEFELSRPQMIIGRTDENDIVVNHRSISRNHAKVVRDPESGRYTISDLQSSNGVRVNGQDYGKVELRRGDVVDLGHVRLRFVEPGEDFLFARDAVITDVPETGGKKGLLVAIILGVLVLGGIGVFFAMKNGDSNTTAKSGSGSGTNGINNTGGGSGSDVVAITNSGNGSDDVVDPPVTVDAGTAMVADPIADLRLECSKYAADKTWAELEKCGTRLAADDPAEGEKFRKLAINENKADAAQRNMTDAIGKKSFKAAKKELDKIPEDSTYRADAKAAYDEAWSLAADDYQARARTAANKNNCREVSAIQREANAKGVGDRAAEITCKPETVAVKPPDRGNGNNNTGTNNKPDKPDKPECDADALRQKGDDHLQTGMDAAALAAFEAAIRCKANLDLYQRAFMAACRSKSGTKAKLYYAKLPSSKQNSLAQICIRYGFDPR